MMTEGDQQKHDLYIPLLGDKMVLCDRSPMPLEDLRQLQILTNYECDASRSIKGRAKHWDSTEGSSQNLAMPKKSETHETAESHDNDTIPKFIS